MVGGNIRISSGGMINMIFVNSNLLLWKQNLLRFLYLLYDFFFRWAEGIEYLVLHDSIPPIIRFVPAGRLAGVVV